MHNYTIVIHIQTTKAKELNLRNRMGENAVHGSDSDENAEIEGAFHFSEEEILS